MVVFFQVNLVNQLPAVSYLCLFRQKIFGDKSAKLWTWP